MTETGVIVDWKGTFGFIKSDRTGKTVFFNRGDWREKEDPEKDNNVSYTETQGDKGPKAINVIKVKISLPEECMFKKSFYSGNNLQEAIFYGAPEKAASVFAKKGLTSNAFRLLFNRLQPFMLSLQDKSISFEEARERFGAFYAEGIIRQYKRGHLPEIVKEFFDDHKNVVLSNEKEMLGFYKYVYNIYCYFGDPK